MIDGGDGFVTLLGVPVDYVARKEHKCNESALAAEKQRREAAEAECERLRAALAQMKADRCGACRAREP
jgi:hypothetical protein